jgi:hypothetical protein
MKVMVQVVLEADDDTPTVVHDVFQLERGPLAIDTLGLQLAEAKDLLSAVQGALVEEQVKAALAAQMACPHCGTARRHKDVHGIVVRTLFGTLRLASPRWLHCLCSRQMTRTFRPLAALLSERTTPELLFLEAKFAGLVSYGLNAKLLAELLPLGRPLHPTVVRQQVQAVAQRLEDELGAEQPGFIEGCPAEWGELPRPDLPLTVGLDGGYVHSADQRSRRDGWFEVIAGRSMPTEGQAKSFGFVQTYDTKPKRRLFEVLRSQGMQPNQQVTFLTDGGEDVRDLPLYLNPQAEHLLDWFHVTMRVTVMAQMAKGLCSPPPLDATMIAEELGRLQWFLWHGNVFRAVQTVDDLRVDLDLEDPGPELRRLQRAVAEFSGYIRANAECIPNYGERYRAGEAISSAFVESAVNQVVSKRMVKKQQMRWTPRGAHLLLQVRTRVLNDELAADFHRWFPGFTHMDPDQRASAA